MIFFGMNHPKHFWMFKNLIGHLKEDGISCKVFVSEKDILPELLNSSGLEYIKLGSNKKGLLNKSLQMIWYTLFMVYCIIKYRPNMLVGQALPHFAFSSFLFKRIKFFILEDTDHVSALHKVTVPFCNRIYTTEKFPIKFGKKQVVLKTYFELLYLHANNFSPDNSVLKQIGLNTNDKYAVLRLVSWNAHHDKNEAGISMSFLRKLIQVIEEKGLLVFITSEIELPFEFEKYRLQAKPYDIHSILYFSSLYIGEGATLAAEAALLGVPSIYINSLDTNYCKELAERYDLMHNYRNTIGVMNSLTNLLDPEAKQCNQKKLASLFKDKIDPIPYFINLIKESF